METNKKRKTVMEDVVKEFEGVKYRHLSLKSGLSESTIADWFSLRKSPLLFNLEEALDKLGYELVLFPKE